MVIEGGKVYVSLAHRYWNEAWDLAKNREVYGADASREGLGANLCLHAFVASPRPLVPGDFGAALEELKRSIDHSSLFDDFPEFTQRASSLEAMARHLADQLFSRPPAAGTWNSFQVWEHEGLGAVVFPGEASIQLKLKRRNLWLTLQGPVDPESGLLVPRGLVTRAVERAYALLGDKPRTDLGKWLFSTLSEDLPQLAELRIDLARHSFHTVGRQDLIV